MDKIVRDCIFLTIEIDKTTDVSSKEQLCEIIRLDQKREIVEMLMKFYNFSTDISVNAISVVAKHILSKYGG